MAAKGFSDIDMILAMEPHGFVTASQLAYELGKGVVPLRSRGKLPGAVQLGEFEVTPDAVLPGSTVLLVGAGASPALMVAAEELRARGLNVRTLSV